MRKDFPNIPLEDFEIKIDPPKGTTKEPPKGGILMDCKYCKDEICVNADCPMCCDYCPVPDDPGVCRFEERGADNG